MAKKNLGVEENNVVPEPFINPNSDLLEAGVQQIFFPKAE